MFITINTIHDKSVIINTEHITQVDFNNSTIKLSDGDTFKLDVGSMSEIYNIVKVN